MAKGCAAVRSRVDKELFRRQVDDLKSAILISGLVGKAVKLKRAGREWKGLCPFHQERTPSFTVVDAHERAYCFGCGWQGDALQFVMDLERCSFREAYRRLANDDLPQWTPAERHAAQIEDSLERQLDEAEARDIFDAASPITGTPAETYLMARGLTGPWPDSIRFALVASWRDPVTREWGTKRPALICASMNGDGELVGIQRIFFKYNDATLGKADCKLSLGSVRGCALRLGPAGETVILAEGPEDGLSLAQEGPGFPVWVAFGTGSMPFMEFPAEVSNIIVAGQNNTAGEKAVDRTVAVLSGAGYGVTTAWPHSDFDDWNDQLRGRCK